MRPQHETKPAPRPETKPAPRPERKEPKYKPETRDRWDVARARKRCARKGCLIGQGEQFREVTSARLPYCANCTREVLGEEPPPDMPTQSRYDLGPKSPSLTDGVNPTTVIVDDVFDPQAYETCKQFGCMGVGERCHRCRRKLPASVRQENERRCARCGDVESEHGLTNLHRQHHAFERRVAANGVVRPVGTCEFVPVAAQTGGSR